MTNEAAEQKAFSFPNDPGLPSVTVTAMSWNTEAYPPRYRMQGIPGTNASRNSTS